MNIPLEWTFKLTGGGEVKNTLNELNASFKKGDITAHNYARGLAMGNREAQRSINVGRYQNNIYLSQYPNILKISRVLSTVTSITRGLLTITNALNISKIRGNQVDEAAADHQRKASEFMREYNRLVGEGKGKTDEARLALEGYNTETALTKQRLQDIKDSDFNEIFTSITSSIFAGSTAWIALKSHLKDIIDGFKTLGFLLVSGLPLAFQGLMAVASKFFSSGAISQGLPFFVAQLLDLIPGMKELRNSFSAWLHSLGQLDARWLDKGVTKFFNVDIPLAIGQAGIALTQFFLMDTPKWGSDSVKLILSIFGGMWDGIKSFFTNGLQWITDQLTTFSSFALSIINSIAAAIRAISFSGGGSGGGSNVFSNPWGVNRSVPQRRAATGFDGMINSPTLFLAGEAGSEHISITPHGGTKSGGGNTIIINVAGSIVSEKKIAYMVDQYQKQNLKSRGFTGFG